MRSNYGTLLSVTEWFEYLQLNRWLGAQFNKYQDLTTPTILKPIQRKWRVPKDACDDAWFEYIYLNGKVARDEVSRAIKQAEEEFARTFGYYPGPVQITETHKYAEFYDPTKPLAGGMWNIKHEPKCFEAEWTKIQALGTFEWTFLNYYSGTLEDLNGDGVKETMVVAGVVTPIGTLLNQIEVYFRDNDFPYGGEEDNTTPEPQWRIYPIEGTVTNADNGNDTMTWQIRFWAWEAVDPNLQLSEAPLELVANVVENFVTSFRFFTKTVDTTNQGVLIYDEWEDCSRSRVDDCFILKERDMICPKPASMTTCTNSFPSAFEVNYIAGCDLQKNGKLDFTCGMIVTMLSAARLACEPCGCGCDGRMPLHWYSEMYKEQMNESNNKAVWILGDPAHDRQNPFGPRNGEVMAWRLARNLAKKKIHTTIP